MHSPNGKIEDLHNFFSLYSGPAWVGVAQRSPATGSCNGLHRESNSEDWSGGVVEWWSGGVVEWWSGGVMV